MKQNVKKLLGCAVAILLTTLAFSQGLDWWNAGPVVLPKHEGSVKAHQELTAKVLNMLLNKQYQKAKDFVYSIPECPTGVIKSNEIPEYCASLSDRATDADHDPWTDWFGTDIDWKIIYVDLEHYQDSNFIQKHVALNTVNPDLILYDAMLKHYEHMFGNSPYIEGNFNRHNYVHFYNIYKNTALEHIAKSSVYNWPHENFESYDNDKKDGAEWYDRIAVGVSLGLQEWQKGIPNYVFECDGYIDENTYYSRVQLLKDFLDGAQAKADEMNDREPFDIIKRKVIGNILNPEDYKRFLHWGDCSSKALHRYMSGFGSENEQEAKELWELLLVSPITEEMQINAQGLYELCWENRNGYKTNRMAHFSVEMKPVWCENFKKNAHKYGFLTDETMELYRNFEQKELQEEMMKAFQKHVYKPAEWAQESEFELPQ